MEALLAKIRARVAADDAEYDAWERKDAKARNSEPARGKLKRSRRSKWAKFLRSEEWKAVRGECLALMGSACVECGSTNNINVDHIKPKSKYPELALALDNLQPLCWPCNKRKGASDV